MGDLPKTKIPNDFKRVMFFQIILKAFLLKFCFVHSLNTLSPWKILSYHACLGD